MRVCIMRLDSVVLLTRLDNVVLLTRLNSVVQITGLNSVVQFTGLNSVVRITRLNSVVGSMKRISPKATCSNKQKKITRDVFQSAEKKFIIKNNRAIFK